MLAGCGGSQTPIGAPEAQTITTAVEESQIIERDPATGSWMSKDAASQNLLYVTDYPSNVAVYTYPAGKLEGVLKGFNSPVSDCVDAQGNVFITNFAPPALYEYAHGGTKRTATLRVPKRLVAPVGCAIDPKTGNLAVTGFSHGAEIFKGAHGTPTFYRDKAFYGMQFCAYDSNGDLFVDGNPTLETSGLVELLRGSRRFRKISLNGPIYEDGGLQWLGDRLAVGAYKSHKPVIYQYKISGGQGKAIGLTLLGPPAYVVLQFLIDGSTVVVPNLRDSNGDASILYYNYPKGGSYTKKILRYVTGPRGVVVSAPK
jgi:hypothetical protein